MPLSPQTVQTNLASAAARLRAMRCLRLLSAGLALSLGLFTLLLIADSFLHFGSVLRWIAFGLVTLPAAIALALALHRATRTISAASMARHIEVATALGDNALISAVQFETQPDSPFKKAVFQEMRDPFPGLDWGRVFDLQRLKRLGLILGTALLGMGFWALLRPMYFANSAQRILLPGKSIAPLSRTRIVSLSPGSTRVLHGQKLVLELEVAGQIPSAAWLYTRESDGPWQKTLMEHELASGRFSFAWKEIRNPFSYRVELGDAVTEVYRVAVRSRSAITSRQVTLRPPAYTGLPQETRSDFSSLQGLVPGTDLSFTLGFNNRVKQLRSDAGMATQPVSPDRWNLSGVLKQTTTVHLNFQDEEGVAESDTLQVAFSPDQAPRIAVNSPPEGKELFAAKEEQLAISFEARDDFGLATLELFRTSEQSQTAELIRGWPEADGKKLFSDALSIPLAKYARDGRVTLAFRLRDKNDVTGPGETWSRPIVVTLRSQQQIAQQQEDASERFSTTLEALLKLQASNLRETQQTLASASLESAPLRTLLERQTQVAELAAQLIAMPGNFAQETRTELQALAAKEMPAAILSLRKAVAELVRAPLVEAVQLEAAILARLQGALSKAENEAVRGKVQESISALDELLQVQRDLLQRTQESSAAGKTLAQEQDALAAKSLLVRKALEQSSADASLGEWKNRITEVAALFKEMKIYEQMLSAAEKLEAADKAGSLQAQRKIVADLTKLAEMLRKWQLAQAQKDAEALKETAKEMKDKLEKLAEIQREVLEKSKEIARKADMRPEDMAVAEEMKKGKDLMAEVVEQMLTDAHVFPDLKPSNELRGELTQIYEDVIQADKAEAEAGTLKANEIAVQKEDSLLKAIEEAKKVAEDLEMWLPNTNDTAKWLLENFDKTEMPDIPNLPLPDAFEDLVGDLLTEQEGLAQEAQDAASNQALAQAQQGWGVADGPMPGFSAQGKSGNTRPNKNEQTGRSSGGREGMSNGEMVGDTASTLEGTTPDARRTNDPMQQGHVSDNGGIQEARATGGGKAGGFSDRNGMDGNAPLRPSAAPRMAAADALAVQQALLAEKTSKAYGKANLLYLKANGLPEAARLMDNAQETLKEGRMDDYRRIHQRIVTRLKEVRSGVLSGEAVVVGSGDKPRPFLDKQLLGGDEGQAPPAYRQAVSDYYKALQQ